MRRINPARHLFRNHSFDARGFFYLSGSRRGMRRSRAWANVTAKWDGDYRPWHWYIGGRSDLRTWRIVKKAGAKKRSTILRRYSPTRFDRYR